MIPLWSKEVHINLLLSSEDQADSFLEIDVFFAIQGTFQAPKRWVIIRKKEGKVSLRKGGGERLRFE